jgi:hypothetical protein
VINFVRYLLCSTNKTDRHDITETLLKVALLNTPTLTQTHICQSYTGADPEGAHPARAPPKIGKNMIFWRKIVIFHTKYPKNFRASLRSAQFF